MAAYVIYIVGYINPNDLSLGQKGVIPSSRKSMIAIEGLGPGDWASMRKDRVVAVMRGRVAIVVVMFGAVVLL